MKKTQYSIKLLVIVSQYRLVKAIDFSPAAARMELEGGITKQKILVLVRRYNDVLAYPRSIASYVVSVRQYRTL